MGDWLNTTVFTSVLRYVLMGVASFVAYRGWATADEASAIAGSALSLATVVFGVVSARFKHVAIDVAGGREVVKDAIAASKPPK